MSLQQILVVSGSHLLVPESSPVPKYLLKNISKNIKNRLKTKPKILNALKSLIVLLWQCMVAVFSWMHHSLWKSRAEHLREFYSWYQGNYFSNICAAVPTRACWKLCFLSWSVMWTWQQKCVADDFICSLSINESRGSKAPGLSVPWSALTSVHGHQHLSGLPLSCRDALLQITERLP